MNRSEINASDSSVQTLLRAAYVKALKRFPEVSLSQRTAHTAAHTLTRFIEEPLMCTLCVSLSLASAVCMSLIESPAPWSG